MKAREAIKKLEEMILKYGDQNIKIAAHDQNENTGTSEVEAIGICADEFGRPYAFMICDKEACLTFS